MPTAVSEEISNKTRAYAENIRKQLQELGGDFGLKGWRIGLLVVEVQDKNVWEILGYETETAFRNFVRIGRSTWFRTSRLTREIALPLMKKEMLTRKSLERLTLENAELLLKLDDRRKFAQSWVTKALTMNEQDFAAQVDHVLENNEEPEEGLGKPESNSTLKIEMKASQKRFILESMKEFAVKWNEDSEHSDSQLKLDDDAGILENLIADARAGW
jgi:hypothetical protein